MTRFEPEPSVRSNKFLESKFLENHPILFVLLVNVYFFWFICLFVPVVVSGGGGCLSVCLLIYLSDCLFALLFVCLFVYFKGGGIFHWEKASWMPNFHFLANVSLVHVFYVINVCY